jgi:hypothetical protein
MLRIAVAIDPPPPGEGEEERNLGASTSGEQSASGILTAGGFHP